MRKTTLRFSALLLVSLTLFLVLSDQQREPRTIEDVVEVFRQAHMIPGAVVAYGVSGSEPTIAAFGVSDPLRNTPMSPDQPFRLASVTKVIAAKAILNAEGQNEIDLDTPIAEQIDLPSPRDPRSLSITPRHLLAHRGGMDSKLSYDPLFAPDRLGLDRSASCAVIARTAWEKMMLDHAPGTNTAYSNVGFCLLSGFLITDHRADLSPILQDVADVRIEGPVTPNWKHNGTSWIRVQNDAEAEGWLSGLGIAGGAIANAEAVWSFVSAHEPDRGIEAPLAGETDFYALGWHVWTHPEGYHLTHWGGLEGIFTVVVRFADGVAIVMLFNASPADRPSAFNYLHQQLLRLNSLKT
ncbi:serine hydrolase domain-containing protein [Ruegeria meonggei]|uniref:Esterase EstB n=1 Tax=Ruegeria meonggei TaxID=1446476 RepID=A0A1X6YCR9_9RHOB|nr:serine hydrolase domain-containing protein [Ruegeria meonggei]SLN15637.1 Esterase EstB [Ruegeria meonggei]